MRDSSTGSAQPARRGRQQRRDQDDRGRHCVRAPRRPPTIPMSRMVAYPGDVRTRNDEDGTHGRLRRDRAAVRSTSPPTPRRPRPASRTGRRGSPTDPEVLGWIDTLPGAEAAAQPGLRGRPLARRTRSGPVRRPPGRPARGRRHHPGDDPGAGDPDQRGRPAGDPGPGLRGARRRPGRSRCSRSAPAPGCASTPTATPTRWSTDDGVRRAGAGPELDCDVRGPAPLPDRPPTVAWRGGIDLHPLDVTDEDQMAWLTTLVWPEHDDRRARLRAARRGRPRRPAGDRDRATCSTSCRRWSTRPRGTRRWWCSTAP